jgi:homoserine O-acetyltransferase/O-succinyltransferase
MTTDDPAARWLHYREDDFILRDFVFTSGEVLPALRLHYRTIGVPRRDASGMIVNGVLLLQGNTGTGANWLRPSLADELYGPGRPLDAHRYVLIMPDALGRGGSSKPSDGLRGHFPHYRYRDMVASGYRFLTEGLGVGHLRLVIGSSMGGMHAWMWAELYPDLMDGVVALSCQPVEISGRNWLARRAAAEAIRHDPDWNNGFYEQNPRHYIYSAAGNFTTESPTRIQEMAPTLAAANALYERRLAEAAQGDANNQLWAIEAIQDYNPEPDLDKITAKVLLINDAEDHANPPELGTVERAMQRVKHGRYVLLPAGPDTHGHFSHYYARLWKPYLIEFMATLGPEQTGAAAVHEARGLS